jgi:hypothetical protein
VAVLTTADERLRDEAFVAAWAADDDRALAALHNVDWPGSRAMRARIYARKGLLERVLAVRDEVEATVSADAAERVEVPLIAAEMLADRGRRVEAVLALHAAGEAAPARDRRLNAQIRVATAAVELSSGNVREAAAAVAAGFALTETLGDDALSAYRLETNHLCARLFELRSRLHALRFAYAAQLDDLCRAISSAKLVRHRDVWHESGLLASISTVVGSFPEASALRLLESASDDLRWNTHLGARECAVRVNLARAGMLYGLGDRIGLPAARLGAPTLAARLALDADRLLFDEWHDAEAYDRELDFAATLAESVAWGEVAGEEILGLATVALALAPRDLARAEAIKGRYDRTLATLSREAAAFLEPRRVAFDDFVSAGIAKARGDEKSARALLDGCIAFWNAREMRAWAAIAMLERFELSGDDRDLEAARAFVATWPRSRFSARLRASLAAATAEPSVRFSFVRPAFLARGAPTPE